MANPEHLAILKQGVTVWNAWRAENEEVWVDLSGANLTSAKTGSLLCNADGKIDAQGLIEGDFDKVIAQQTPWNCTRAC